MDNKKEILHSIVIGFKFSVLVAVMVAITWGITEVLEYLCENQLIWAMLLFVFFLLVIIASILTYYLRWRTGNDIRRKVNDL